jgi:polysaccharide biosynthesis protein PslH
MRKILIVSHFFPIPPQHGSAADIWGQIVSLNALGYMIDLVATDSREPTGAELSILHTNVRNVWCVRRVRSIWQILSVRPFQVESRRGLRAVQLTEHYDDVILETEYVADILLNRALRATSRVLRIHNDEVRYYRDLSRDSKSRFESIVFFADSLKFRLFSPSVWARCQQFWFISDFERAAYTELRRVPERSAFFVPPRVDLSRMRPHHSTGEGVLFIGALTRPMNMRGLLWYVREVHPRITIGSYRLMIAGHTGGESITWLKALSEKFPNITVLPDVPDLSPLYRENAVFVNPIFSGAGLKLKTIHALAAGLPVVTTNIGVEGTRLRNGDHVIVANSAQEFANGVSALLSDQDRRSALVDAAQGYMRTCYDQEGVIASCLEALSSSE